MLEEKDQRDSLGSDSSSDDDEDGSPKTKRLDSAKSRAGGAEARKRRRRKKKTKDDQSPGIRSTVYSKKDGKARSTNEDMDDDDVVDGKCRTCNQVVSEHKKVNVEEKLVQRFEKLVH